MSPSRVVRACPAGQSHRFCADMRSRPEAWLISGFAGISH